MIDLVLWAADKPTFRTFAINNNLLVDDGDGGFTERRGFTWTWWAGDSGKLMTQAGTYDQDGNELTPPQFLAGFVALCRIHGDFFDTDRLEPLDADPDKEEQWARSKVSRYIKNNGTPGTTAGGTIPYYELDGVRMFRPVDVQDYLSSNNLPGHEWLGGNSF